MAVYFQLGHQSDNLIEEENLRRFKGAIISPVNYSPQNTLKILERKIPRDDFKYIFDPQLYYPRSRINNLVSWDYFPSEFETANNSDLAWWKNRLDKLTSGLNELNINNFCTPVSIPKIYSSNFYTDNNNILKFTLDKYGSDFGILQTILLPLNLLSDEDFIGRTTSIITQSECKHLYIIFINDLNPRREYKDTDELQGAMRIIRLLEENSFKTLVSYCSTNVLLWKHSGATDCATGKFFNLRNFTPSRWISESDGGGGQLPYWVEESLLAYLRESDIPRAKKAELISQSSLYNPYYDVIMDSISNGNAWIKHSWCFYLYWFGEIENKLATNNVSALDLLQTADENWGHVEEGPIYFEERYNNGDWIRFWLRAITES